MWFNNVQPHKTKFSMKERPNTWFLFSSFLNARVRNAPAAALCTFVSVNSSNSTRGGIPPSILHIHIHSRWSHKGNVVESQALSRAYKKSKPDTGFNAAVLMGKVSDGIGSSTNDTIHCTRARTIFVPL